jgi:phenol 2-monooxygenase
LSGEADPVLETFEPERADTARQLIAFDTTFSHIFSGKIRSGDSTATGLTHEEFLRVFREGNGFTSGCGLHYKPSTLVRTSFELHVNLSGTDDPLSGTLVPGRRLLNVELKRYADATTRQLQDGTSYSSRCQRKGRRLTQTTELPSVGRYRIIVLASNDLLDRSGVTQPSLVSCIDIMQRFPAGTIDLVVLHPLKTRFEWTDIPPNVKGVAEMRTYGLSRKEDAYEIYGVCKDKGLIAVVRPDGYVGMLAPLSGPNEVEGYLRSCLILV